MTKRKWHAGQTEEDQVSFLQRFRKPIAIAAILAAAVGFFIYRFNNSRYQYGDARSDYNRALADCMKDRTQMNAAGDAVEQAAEACVRDVPAPPGGDSK